MECPICYDTIQYSAIGTCTHHFCFKCLLNWVQNNGEKCPICKTRILSIRRDLEFDKLIGNNEIELDKLIKTIKINFNKDERAGITLTNNFSKNYLQKKIPGVKVSNIVKNQNCFKYGVKKGDIILFINNIPCINHEQVIQIIDEAVKSNSFINLSIQ